VTAETPTALDLEARTAMGLKVSGVQGSLELHTSDGAVDVEDVGGAVRLTASDGSIKIHNVTGTWSRAHRTGMQRWKAVYSPSGAHQRRQSGRGGGSQLSTASRSRVPMGR